MQKIGFVGQYSHTLDDKGRVSIPSRFKKYIEDSGTGTESVQLVLSIGADKCVEALSVNAWERMKAVYEQEQTLDAAVKANIRQRTMNTFPVNIDKSGRIIIPEPLKKLAGIQKNVVFVGVVDRFEIWDEAALDTHLKKSNGGNK